MADALFCSQCGTQNTAGAVFCQRCGAGLQPRTQITTGAAPVGAYVASSAGYGGFWIRFVAFVIDGIIISIACIPVVMVLGAMGLVHHPTIIHGRFDETDMAALIALSFTLRLVLAAISWLYEALLTSSTWQGTVGKKILNLKVIDEAGNRISFARATGRHFAKYLSSFLFIGFIMAAFTDRKRALHDIIAGTLVRKG
jgi:uncharacterized RDD family membrane protein YckC